MSNAKADKEAEMHERINQVYGEHRFEKIDKKTGLPIKETEEDVKRYVQKHKYMRIINRVLFTSIVLAILGFGAYKIIRGFRTIDEVRKPIQKDIVQAIADGDTTETGYSFSTKDGHIDMEYLATYDIEGLVTYIDEYDDLWANLTRDKNEGMTFEERVIPRDLVIVWGSMAANANRFIYGHRYRQSRIKALGSDAQWIDSDGDHLYSNNHIIVEPGTEQYKKLMKVKNRDHIRIKGYLIEATFYDNAMNWSYTSTSSLSRSDTTSSTNIFKDPTTNCEIIYMTDLEWL